MIWWGNDMYAGKDKRTSLTTLIALKGHITIASQESCLNNTLTLSVQ